VTSIWLIVWLLLQLFVGGSAAAVTIGVGHVIGVTVT
jgi:hypothetical protein